MIHYIGLPRLVLSNRFGHWINYYGRIYGLLQRRIIEKQSRALSLGEVPIV